jgi:hypothetical protein
MSTSPGVSVGDRLRGSLDRLTDSLRGTLFEQLDELGQREHALAARAAVHDSGYDVALLEPDDEVGAAQVFSAQGPRPMSRDVEPAGGSGLDRLRKSGCRADLERPERAHAHGQVGEQIAQESLSNRAPSAVSRAKQDKLEPAARSRRIELAGALPQRVVSPTPGRARLVHDR